MNLLETSYFRTGPGKCWCQTLAHQEKICIIFLGLSSMIIGLLSLRLNSSLHYFFSRFWVEGVAITVVGVIGLAGNFLAVLVLKDSPSSKSFDRLLIRFELFTDPDLCKVEIGSDQATRSTCLWVYISSVHCTFASQSRPIIRRRINSLTLLSAYFSTFQLLQPWRSLVTEDEGSYRLSW